MNCSWSYSPTLQIHNLLFSSSLLCPCSSYRCSANCVTAPASAQLLPRSALSESLWCRTAAAAARCVPGREESPAPRRFPVTAGEDCSVTTAPAFLETPGSVSVSDSTVTSTQPGVCVSVGRTDGKTHKEGVKVVSQGRTGRYLVFEVESLLNWARRPDGRLCSASFFFQSGCWLFSSKGRRSMNVIDCRDNTPELPNALFGFL